MPTPRMVLRGEFGRDVGELVARKLAPVARHAHELVLDVGPAPQARGSRGREPCRRGGEPRRQRTARPGRGERRQRTRCHGSCGRPADQAARRSSGAQSPAWPEDPVVGMARRVTGWRRLAGAAWDGRTDPQFHGELEIDATALLSYVEQVRASSEVQVFGWAVARVLVVRPPRSRERRDELSDPAFDHVCEQGDVRVRGEVGGDAERHPVAVAHRGHACTQPQPDGHVGEQLDDRPVEYAHRPRRARGRWSSP